MSSKVKDSYTYHLHSQFVQLLTQIRHGRLGDAIRTINDDQAVLSLRDRNGRTSLHHCADLDHHQNLSSLSSEMVNEIAQTLISIRPDLLSAQDNNGNVPLHLAVINGNVTLTRALLHSMNIEQINAADHELHTVVHWAVVCGQLECLMLVLDRGANVSTPDIYGAHPIHYATQCCLFEDCMFHAGAPILIPPVSSSAILSSDHSSSAIPFARNEKRKRRSNSLSSQAILRQLLGHQNSRKKIDINCSDNEGRTPLLWASSSGNHEALLELVKAGAEISQQDREGLSALHCAASRGNYRCVHSLITMCGADVRQLDSSGCTPLFYATALGHADCVRLLIESDADLDHQDNKGRTAAHCGASKGQLETLKILHQHGANLWLKNSRGDLPLHEAVKSGRIDLVKWLLEQNSKAVNETNLYGRSPMHIAAFNNNIELCKLLLAFGAEINSVMKVRSSYLTPLDAALQNGTNDQMIEFLQQQGAQPVALVNSRLRQSSSEEVEKLTKRHLADSFEVNDSDQREHEEFEMRHQQQFKSHKHPKKTETFETEAKQCKNGGTKLPNLINNHQNYHQARKELTSSGATSVVNSATRMRNAREYETALLDKPGYLKQAIITNVYLTAAPLAPMSGANGGLYYLKRVPPLKKPSNGTKKASKKKNGSKNKCKTSDKAKKSIGEDVSVVLETHDTFQSSLESREERSLIEEELRLSKKALPKKTSEESGDTSEIGDEEDEGEEEEASESEEDGRKSDDIKPKTGKQQSEEKKSAAHILQPVQMAAMPLTRKLSDYQKNDHHQNSLAKSEKSSSTSSSSSASESEQEKDEKEQTETSWLKSKLSQVAEATKTLTTENLDSVKSLIEKNEEKSPKQDLTDQLVQRDFVRSIDIDNDDDGNDGRKKRSVEDSAQEVKQSDSVVEPILERQKTFDSLTSRLTISSMDDDQQQPPSKNETKPVDSKCSESEQKSDQEKSTLSSMIEDDDDQKSQEDEMAEASNLDKIEEEDETTPKLQKDETGSKIVKFSIEKTDNSGDDQDQGSQFKQLQNEPDQANDDEPKQSEDDQKEKTDQTSVADDLKKDEKFDEENSKGSRQSKTASASKLRERLKSISKDGSDQKDSEGSRASSASKLDKKSPSKDKSVEREDSIKATDSENEEKDSRAFSASKFEKNRQSPSKDESVDREDSDEKDPKDSRASSASKLDKKSLSKDKSVERKDSIKETDSENEEKDSRTFSASKIKNGKKSLSKDESVDRENSDEKDSRAFSTSEFEKNRQSPSKDESFDREDSNKAKDSDEKDSEGSRAFSASKLDKKSPSKDKSVEKEDSIKPTDSENEEKDLEEKDSRAFSASKFKDGKKSPSEDQSESESIKRSDSIEKEENKIDAEKTLKSRKSLETGTWIDSGEIEQAKQDDENMVDKMGKRLGNYLGGVVGTVKQKAIEDIDKVKQFLTGDDKKDDDPHQTRSKEEESHEDQIDSEPKSNQISQIEAKTSENDLEKASEDGKEESEKKDEERLKSESLNGRRGSYVKRQPSVFVEDVSSAKDDDQDDDGGDEQSKETSPVRKSHVTSSDEAVAPTKQQDEMTSSAENLRHTVNKHQSPSEISDFGPIRELKGKKKAYSHVRSKVDSFWSGTEAKQPSPSTEKISPKIKHGTSMGHLAGTNISTADEEYYARIDPKIINQTVEKCLRKYHFERKVFEELYDLKRCQIRTGKSNEPQLVKRLVEKFRRDIKAPGMADFDGPYTYRAYEMYLYDILRHLSRSNERKVLHLQKSMSFDDMFVNSNDPEEDYHYLSDASSIVSDKANRMKRDTLNDYDRRPMGISIDYTYEYHKSQHLDSKTRNVVVDVVRENLYKRTGLNGNKTDELAVKRKIIERKTPTKNDEAKNEKFSGGEEDEEEDGEKAEDTNQEQEEKKSESIGDNKDEIKVGKGHLKKRSISRNLRKQKNSSKTSSDVVRPTSTKQIQTRKKKFDYLKRGRRIVPLGQRRNKPTTSSLQPIVKDRWRPFKDATTKTPINSNEANEMLVLYEVNTKWRPNTIMAEP